MDPETVIHIGRESLFLVLILSAAPVLTAMVVGLIVSVFQAATQLQEQTLTVVPKIVAVYVVLVAAGLWALKQLMQFAVLLFDGIAHIGR